MEGQADTRMESTVNEETATVQVLDLPKSVEEFKATVKCQFERQRQGAWSNPESPFFLPEDGLVVFEMFLDLTLQESDNVFLFWVMNLMSLLLVV